MRANPAGIAADKGDAPAVTAGERSKIGRRSRQATVRAGSVGLGRAGTAGIGRRTGVSGRTGVGGGAGAAGVARLFDDGRTRVTGVGRRTGAAGIAGRDLHRSAGGVARGERQCDGTRGYRCDAQRHQGFLQHRLASSLFDLTRLPGKRSFHSGGPFKGGRCRWTDNARDTVRSRITLLRLASTSRETPVNTSSGLGGRGVMDARNRRRRPPSRFCGSPFCRSPAAARGPRVQ